MLITAGANQSILVEIHNGRQRRSIRSVVVIEIEKNFPLRELMPSTDDRKAVVVQNENAVVPAAASDSTNLEEIITIDPETEELYLNHKRISKMEHFEPLVKIER